MDPNRHSPVQFYVLLRAVYLVIRCLGSVAAIGRRGCSTILRADFVLSLALVACLTSASVMAGPTSSTMIAVQTPRSKDSGQVKLTYEQRDIRKVVPAFVAAMQREYVLSACVKGRLSGTFGSSGSSELLSLITSSVGAKARADQYGVLYIGLDCLESSRDSPIDIGNLDVRDAVVRVSDHFRLPIMMGPNVRGRVPAPCVTADWRAAVAALATSGAVTGERLGVVFVVSSNVELGGVRRIELAESPVRDAMRKIAAEGAATVAVDEGVTGNVSMCVWNVSWRHALGLAANAVGARIVRTEAKRSYRVLLRENQSGAEATGKDYVMDTDAKGLRVDVTMGMLGGSLYRYVNIAIPIEARASTFVMRGVRDQIPHVMDLIAEGCGLELVELADGGLRIEERR